MIQDMRKIIKDLWKTFKIYIKEKRENNPKIFDWIAKFGGHIFSFITCFMPAFFTPNWVVFLLISVFYSFTLVFQWAVLTNRENDVVSELNKKHEAKIRELRQTYEKDGFVSSTANFSHYVSNRVKDITARIPTIPDGTRAVLISDFFNESLNKIEELLSEYYGEEIRASIKLNSSNEAFKTYGRGKNNIKSRGGEAAIAIANQETVEITQNYAYRIIIEKCMPYFAEGDLSSLSNKLRDDDKFYCEYKDYSSKFNSTIIISLRFPVFKGKTKNLQNYEILGIICIDCKKCMSEWSRNDITTSLGYHIIANYVDSLCILIKKYSDGVRKRAEKQSKNCKKNSDKNETRKGTRT